ncbi:MAG TPA: anthranilate synthase component I family protein [Crocinitomix sp.]|nr:anthranilate synthase component I family protein [Crocinitomix sp.]
MKNYFKISNIFNAIEFIQTNKIESFSLIDDNKGDFIFGWEVEDELIQEEYTQNKLKTFEDKHKDFIFGFIGYDAKNKTLSKVKSKNIDIHQFPESVFFTCYHVVIKKGKNFLYYGTNKSFSDFKNKQYTYITSVSSKNKAVSLQANISKKDYVNCVDAIKSKIQNGDIYEANYCIQFKELNTTINSIETYKNLKKNTKAPFSLFFKYKHIHILSASPERFYKKENNIIISQPIKGTARRGKNEIEDQNIKQQLKKNTKEISENIMIVDLVRNDLSRLPHIKSVETTELCKLYTFDTVHQLISTVKATLNTTVSLNEVLADLFPMGSMTGAPKISACQIIDEVENFKRGIYSGTVGFISPNKNHDFNVVIRSVLYNSNNKTVSVSVGGAITIKSIAEQEYNECLLKLKAISRSIVGLSNN